MYTPGGMAKVIEILSKNPPEGWAADSLNRSIRTKEFLSKVAGMAKGKEIPQAINIDDYDIVHIHSAADWSYWKKVKFS